MSARLCACDAWAVRGLTSVRHTSVRRGVASAGNGEKAGLPLRFGASLGGMGREARPVGREARGGICREPDAVSRGDLNRGEGFWSGRLPVRAIASTGCRRRAIGSCLAGSCLAVAAYSGMELAAAGGRLWQAAMHDANLMPGRGSAGAMKPAVRMLTDLMIQPGAEAREGGYRSSAMSGDKAVRRGIQSAEANCVPALLSG